MKKEEIINKAKNIIDKYDALKDESVAFITKAVRSEKKIMLYSRFNSEGDFEDEEEAYEEITGASPVITADWLGNVHDMYLIGLEYEETPQDKRTPYHIKVWLTPEDSVTYAVKVDISDIFSDSYSSIVDFIAYMLS